MFNFVKFIATKKVRELIFSPPVFSCCWTREPRSAILVGKKSGSGMPDIHPGSATLKIGSLKNLLGSVLYDDTALLAFLSLTLSLPFTPSYYMYYNKCSQDLFHELCLHCRGGRGEGSLPGGRDPAGGEGGGRAHRQVVDPDPDPAFFLMADPGSSSESRVLMTINWR
jgi:hypothetical protein